jgi:uncharacterized membrane protein
MNNENIRNGNEYINALNYHLRKLPACERADAIAYYSEYLAEAGPGGEAEAIRRLGSPMQLAVGIRADAAMRDLDDEDKPKVKKSISAVWIAIIAVFAIPVGGPVAVCVAAVVISILISIFAVLLSLFVTAAAMVLSGIFSIILGFYFTFSAPPVMLFYVGCGLVVAVLGGFIWLFILWLSKITFRGIAALFNKIRHRKASKISKNADNAKHGNAKHGK